MLSLFLVAAFGVINEQCARDQSGIGWVLPFTQARAQAAAAQRLLFIKPIAFGTTKDGGW